MEKLSGKKEGFTLIELLIVVAIIGIIAGIAIPNFLGARTKARVTRAFADMRAIADALESYYVDNTTYPAEDSLSDVTPAHITSLSNDPFSTADPPAYRYYNNDDTTPTAWLLVSNGPDGSADVTEATAGFSWDDADRVAGQIGGPEGPHSGYGVDLWYNPANGTTSAGDLGRGGP
jgi:type II secretion system protein G